MSKEAEDTSKQTEIDRDRGKRERENDHVLQCRLLKPPVLGSNPGTGFPEM
jgi:hypothetical protein